MRFEYDLDVLKPHSPGIDYVARAIMEVEGVLNVKVKLDELDQKTASLHIKISGVDVSLEAHMLDLLIYRSPAQMQNSRQGKFKYMVAGRSCLAGDVFGTYRFKNRLKVGSIVKFFDTAGYSMVKKNWFNGLKMPSIAVKRLNGKIELVQKFGYKDFLKSLS